jgi:hypothetical protein
VYGWESEGWVGSSEGCFRGQSRARNKQESVLYTIDRRGRLLTLKRNPREGVFFSGRCIGLGIFVILIQLFTFRIVAYRVPLENITRVTGMVNFLFTRSKKS